MPDISWDCQDDSMNEKHLQYIVGLELQDTKMSKNTLLPHSTGMVCLSVFDRGKRRCQRRWMVLESVTPHAGLPDTVLKTLTIPQITIYFFKKTTQNPTILISCLSFFHTL
jgi:hypothetical protein